MQWLHRQSQYQVAFDQIQLAHELPSWYRGGKREFLGRVRRGSGQSEVLSQLEVRPDRLALAFKLDPWVEEVVKVSYGPGRIVVDLKFREPVAWVKLGDGRQQMIDGEARLLPGEDVELEALDGLLRITGVGLSAAADQRAGVVWKSKARGEEVEQAEERIVAAAGLARFLNRQVQSAGSPASAAVRMIEISVSDFRNRGLFVFNAEGTVFRWGRALGLKHRESPLPTRNGRWC